MTSAAPVPTILLLGGTARERDALGAALRDGFECLAAPDTATAWQMMSEHFVQVLVCGGAIPGADCGEVFSHLHRHWPETMLVTVTDPDTECTGALPDNLHQMLVRPWNPDQLRIAVTGAARVFALSRDNERMALEMRCVRAPRRPDRGTAALTGFDRILRNPGSPVATLVTMAQQVASFDIPAVLQGEPGTGKTALAEGIHLSSMRSDQPFVTLACAGLSEAAVQAALFGRRKPENGTPAYIRTGLVQKADQGTLYLTGVEGLSHEMQARLLRLVREGQYEQEGSEAPKSSHVRLLAGFTEDPAQLIAAGRLLPALYYALAVGELHVPPLRAREADLPLLAQDAAERAGRLHGKIVHGLSEAALEFLAAYDWPGNLHELENEITRMLILTQAPLLGPDVISRRILQARPCESDAGEAAIMAGDAPLKDRIEAIEARILRETLTRLRWNKSRAAAELGLSRVGLRAKLDRYGIAQPHPEHSEDA